MGSGRPGPHPGVQADGEDVDQDLPVAGWLRNLRIDPRARLRIRGGTFEGVARDLRKDERARAETLYCQFTGPFELLESLAHLPGWPNRRKISGMHRHWFRSGTPIAIDLATAG